MQIIIISHLKCCRRWEFFFSSNYSFQKPEVDMNIRRGIPLNYTRLLETWVGAKVWSLWVFFVDIADTERGLCHWTLKIVFTTTITYYDSTALPIYRAFIVIRSRCKNCILMKIFTFMELKSLIRCPWIALHNTVRFAAIFWYPQSFVTLTLRLITLATWDFYWILRLHLYCHETKEFTKSTW